MDKYELIDISKRFMTHIVDINSYHDIMKQYSVNSKEYPDAMSYSPAYYNTVYNSLTYSLIMSLSRVFDERNDTVHLKKLLDLARIQKTQFVRYPKNDDDQINPDFIRHYRKTIDSPFDHEYFKEDKDYDFMTKMMDAMYPGENVPVVLELSVDEYFDYFDAYYKHLSIVRKNLKYNRNKVYAHHDYKVFTQPVEQQKLQNDHPLTFGDVNLLIDLASDICQFIIGGLTDIHPAKKYSHIKDWAGTLNLAEQGYEYINSDEYLEKQKHEIFLKMKMNPDIN